MSSAAIEAWAACISDLQQLLQLTEQEPSADAEIISSGTAFAMVSCQQRLAQLKQQPTLAHAEFKELVQDVQVRLPVSVQL